MGVAVRAAVSVALLCGYPPFIRVEHFGVAAESSARPIALAAQTKLQAVASGAASR
jgi:hypothetical protein